MNRVLTVHRAGPGVTVQDMGRSGFLSQGLSRGGTIDTLALAEGAALLEQNAGLAVLELANAMLVVEANTDTRIALTGAEMRATLDGVQLGWNASHLLPAAARLELLPLRGGYGYLHLGGGIDSKPFLGSRSTHLACNLGSAVEAGDRLALGQDGQGRTGLKLAQAPRVDGRTIRLVCSPQTNLFAGTERDRFEGTLFRKDTRGNRMGQRLVHDGPGFATDGGLKILSEPIIPGDIQITGDGTPFVLLAECQTTGGYPRIGTVLTCDLPHLVRAPVGATFSFRFVTLEQAIEAEQKETRRRAALRKTLQPVIRDPRDIPDLLTYQLISGVTLGDDLDRTVA